MTFIFKKVEASSKEELLNLVAKNCKVLDSNIEIVGSSVGKSSRALWDLVGIDSDKRLVVIGIELKDNYNMLCDVMDRLEWAREHIDIIARIYPSSGVDRNLTPRAIIISPSYSSSFKKIISYLTDQKINLFTFTYMASEEGKGILLEPVEIQKRQESIPERQEHIPERREYIPESQEHIPERQEHIPERQEHIPERDVSFIQSVEIPHIAKVTSEEIKEFLQ